MWHLKVNDRLSYWREFRRRIGQLDFKNALIETNDLWNNVPYVHYYLDPNQPKSWPDPWTLLAENYYCDIAKTLGIIYTIYLSEHKKQAENFELCILLDKQDNYQYNLACFENGKYILNYWPAEIVNIEQVREKQNKTLYQYSKIDLELEKY